MFIKTMMTSNSWIIENESFSLQLNSEELAQTLDLQPGPYRIKDPQQPVVGHNLTIPLRTHAKSTIVCTTNDDPLALLNSATDEEPSLNLSEPGPTIWSSTTTTSSTMTWRRKVTARTAPTGSSNSKGLSCRPTVASAAT